MCGIGRGIKNSTNRTVGSGRVVSCEKSRFQEGDIALNFKKGGGGSAEKRTGNAIPSRYVPMSQSFSKQANNLWFHIYQVVREICSSEYKGATLRDDMDEDLV